MAALTCLHFRHLLKLSKAKPTFKPKPGAFENKQSPLQYFPHCQVEVSESAVSCFAKPLDALESINCTGFACCSECPATLRGHKDASSCCDHSPPSCMARLGNASQRARPFFRVASFVVIASTVLFTLFTVRHLAGAIAVRHSLANSGEFEVQGHKLLSHTTDVVDKSHPHWLSDGSVRKPVDSIRGKSLLYA